MKMIFGFSAARRAVVHNKSAKRVPVRFMGKLRTFIKSTESITGKVSNDKCFQKKGEKLKMAQKGN
jgi:hypothetical protein